MANVRTVIPASFHNQADLNLDRQLVESSGLFDERDYTSRAGLDVAGDPIGHYLVSGWRLGIEPNSWFSGTAFQPYYESAGFQGPPLITWLIHRAARWNVPLAWNEAKDQAARIRSTSLFDERYYKIQVGAVAGHLDLAIHYVLVGERLGFRPAPEFDPKFYLECYPDVADAGVSPLLHYLQAGREEGRLRSAGSSRCMGAVKEDPLKQNIILVTHDTSRTGAPIIAWNLVRRLCQKYNIFTIRVGNGELTEHFEAESVEVYGPFPGPYGRTWAYMDRALDSLFKSRTFLFAIVNSVESRHCLPSLNYRYIASVLLVHEFSFFVQPQTELAPMFDWASEIVFPAQVVAKSAEDRCPSLLARQIKILPQGPNLPPKGNPQPTKKKGKVNADEVLKAITRRHEEENAFIVLSVGYVQIRKGVDLFISAAAAVCRSKPQRPFHFLWVGDGYHPEQDVHYGSFLFEQIQRSGVEGCVTLLSAVSDVTPIYRIADAFFLSSRMDPFPNVAIDAMMPGIPLVCFRGASGTADLLLTNPTTSALVVDYLDVNAASEVMVRLAADKKWHTEVSDAMRQLANVGLPDMEIYAARLDEMGISAESRMRRREADGQTLLRDTAFEEFMFLDAGCNPPAREHTIATYLATSESRGPLIEQVRRPCPGFHPYVYKAQHPARMLKGENPLADFIRNGKPAGRWMLPVLRPADEGAECSGILRVALHAHFYYPELAEEFLAHLYRNKSSYDLLISTDTPKKAAELARVFSRFKRGKLDIQIMPNRGRDMGPLLSGFAHKLDDYDIVGHVHAKRSLIVGDDAIGESWRRFLWQHLLGGQHAMLDRVVAAFEQDEKLGLVFPSDPHLIGWNDNRGWASELAQRMGWRGELPDHFDFPLGTMFWMRRKALEPLFNLNLDWKDYPDEPVPYDGTILHAIERLMPTVNQLAGFDEAVTHVLGVAW